MKPSINPVKLSAVKINGGFWGSRLETVRTRTIPHLHHFLKEIGYLDAWNLNWKEGQPKKPHIFWDSDVAKWMEAVAYSLTWHPDAELEALLDTIIERMARAQAPDGYLNTYYLTVEPGKRWMNERAMHETYCAGHLIEAAVAYYETTGKRRFLEIMQRYADHIASVFGPGEGQIHGYPGHEEIELALVKLYRASGEARYLDLARFFIDERGKQPHYFDVEARARGEDPAPFHAQFLDTLYGDYSYFQAHVSVRQQSEAVGHAVRATYLYSGMADVAALDGDDTLLDACRRIWQNLTERRMYVTAGIGAAGNIEGFSTDYDLPNETAYAETCASIGLALWAQRMANIEQDRKYYDIFERALYNGILSGVALDGQHFFYPNPLAVYPSPGLNGAENPQSTGGFPQSTGGFRYLERQDWFGCACCPTNITRFLAGLGQFIYSSAPDEAVVHLYIDSQASLKLAGEAVQLTQRTEYPWDGKVTFTIDLAAPVQFTLALRIPAWCRGASLTVNGQAVDTGPLMQAGYARLTHTWRPGDQVTLDLPMPVEHMHANPLVKSDMGRAALQRGPLVYCLEETDNGANLNALRLPEGAGLEAAFNPGLLGGIIALNGEGLRLRQADWAGALYLSGDNQAEIPALLTAVPYALWANRKPGEMIVWIRE